MTALLGLNDYVLELNDHSLITSLMGSHCASMSQPLARHFAHYAAIRALDPLRKYLKCKDNISQTFNKRPVLLRVRGTMSCMAREQQR
jgi:hypothetical protein